MSETQTIEEKKSIETKSRAPKSQKEPRKAAISDELVERALNGRSNNSEFKEIIERVANGAILSKDNRAIEIIDSNVGAISRVIKSSNLKGKVRTKSCEKGKNRPSMIWRVA